MDFKPQSVLQGMAGALMCLAIVAGAQTPSCPTPTTAPDATALPQLLRQPQLPAAPTWSVGTIDFSGYIDGYFSYNANRPARTRRSGQTNELITSTTRPPVQPGSREADPEPRSRSGRRARRPSLRPHQRLPSHGGRLRRLINYIEQAYISIKPPKAKGFELDFGQFITSAGQEVIETMNNWSYSHGILFSTRFPTTTSASAPPCR